MRVRHLHDTGRPVVYAGLPWGVAVYDFNGAPVTRIVLGSAVTAMVATAAQVWVGTPEGLFRIAAGTWSITHEALGQVTALALDGEQLWIGVRGGVMLMNRRTLALRTFSAEELGFEHPPEFSRFEPDREFVWADGSHGLLRYDRAADTWNAWKILATAIPCISSASLTARYGRMFTSTMNCATARAGGPQDPAGESHPTCAATSPATSA